MANRIPLVVDRDDSNKLKELPIGDSLNLTGSGIVGAGNIEATGLTIAGISYNPFSGSWNDLTDKPTVAADTSELPESGNLYFTNERVDDRVASILREGSGIDIVYDDLAGTITITSTGGGGGGGGGGGDLPTNLTGLALNQILKYSTSESAFVNSFINYSEIIGTPTFATVATTGSYNDLVNKPLLVDSISDLSDVDTVTSTPATGQVLKWDGNKWAPADDITTGGGGLDATTLNGFNSAYYLDYNNFTNKPTLFDGNFSSLLGTPTDLAGYGITDAISTNSSYTQNGSIVINSDVGLTIGTDNNIRLRVDNSNVKIESTVNEQDLEISVKPLSGATTAIKIDTGTQRIGIFNTNPQRKLDVAGDVNATAYFGSGANLTGITLDSVTDIGSETSNSVAFGNIAPFTANTYSLGSNTNRYQNAYINTITATTVNGTFVGDGSSVTDVDAVTLGGATSAQFLSSDSDDATSGSLSIRNNNGILVGLTDNHNIKITGDGVIAENNISNEDYIIRTTNSLGKNDVVIVDAQNVRVGIKKSSPAYTLDVDGDVNVSGNFKINGADLSLSGVGNFTLSNSVIATDDSSVIILQQPVTMRSDAEIDGNLQVDGALNVNGTLTADSFNSSSTGVPTIDSASSIVLKAQDQVKISSSPLRMASFTTTQRDALISANGDMIYNSSTGKFQGYAAGNWVDLH